MIFLRIVSKKESQLTEIAKMLLTEKLAMDITIKTSMTRITLQNDKLVNTPVFLLTAKTRGILFPMIDDYVKSTFSQQMPEVYSLPIIYMDWDQARTLVDHIKTPYH